MIGALIVLAFFFVGVAALVWWISTTQPRDVEERLMDQLEAIDELRAEHPDDADLAAMLDEKESDIIHEAFRLGMGHTIVARREEGKAQKETT
jgi:hypothetical protein